MRLATHSQLFHLPNPEHTHDLQAVGVAGGLIGAWGMLVFKRGPSAGTVFDIFAASHS